MLASWGIFKVYDFFRMIRTPKFLKAVLDNLYLILTKIFLAVGEGYIESISAEIIRVSGENISGAEKFKKVFTYAKKEAPQLKDRYINLLIETLIAQLKEGKVI